ncbi:MAG: DNA polymerase domain-containing protein, partial [Halobacteriota archaeon]
MDDGQSGLGRFDGDRGDATEKPGANEAERHDAVGLEIGVTRVDYTVEDTDDGPRPVVHVFGRTTDGEARHVEVTGFQPYFYAPSHEVDDAEDERVVDVEDGYTSIEGEEMGRIYTRIPADVGEIRDSYTHHEADILFPNRFRIDLGVKSGLRVPDADEDTVNPRVDVDEVEAADVEAPARVMVVDIEVEDRHGFPEDGEQPLICLTAWDSFERVYHVFVWHPEDGTEVHGVSLDVDVEHEVHEYAGEEEMLAGFLDYLDSRDPDVTTGWNYDDFDAPYLIDRLDRLGMESDRLSRVGEVWHTGGGWGGPTIKGRSTFDLLYGYQRMRFTELESYRLDAIAEEELGEKKVTYTGDLGDLWEGDPERLLKYNLKDVELCVRIDDKVGVVDFFRELARFVGCSLEDSTTPSDVVDVYVLRKAHGEFVLPSKRGGGSGDEYEGGEVFEPITGIRENVVVLDLASLYPMSMISVNASPETKVDEGFDGPAYHVEMPDGSVVRFRKDREGLTKAIVTELLDERDRKKELRDSHEMGSAEYDKYDDQQNAIKVVMNSYYGVAGYSRFRLYDSEMGAAVTATGRKVIEHTRDEVERLGYDVIY